jgi:hypothetical protein
LVLEPDHGATVGVELDWFWELPGGHLGVQGAVRPPCRRQYLIFTKDLSHFSASIVSVVDADGNRLFGYPRLYCEGGFSSGKALLLSLFRKYRGLRFRRQDFTVAAPPGDGLLHSTFGAGAPAFELLDDAPGEEEVVITEVAVYIFPGDGLALALPFFGPVRPTRGLAFWDAIPPVRLVLDLLKALLKLV